MVRIAKFVPYNKKKLVPSNHFSTTVKTKYEEFWMPFTDNRSFKQSPKLIKSAKGMYYYDEDGNEMIDASAGLWCVNAGHGQERIVNAIKNQADKLEYTPHFNLGHELPFEFSRKILELLSPERDFGHVFFTMCGSTSVDSALKIALAYHRANGHASKTRFIGRERGYHGVGFGGISVGGISPNRKAFSPALISGVDHLPHTHSLPHMAFSKGHPSWGLHLADDLERIIALHDASNIAAVIVEPVAGSTGVLVPPVGYLEKLREICTKHDILLIFDEVITGFGRLGASFATERFNVTPDLITCAKGLTSGYIPAGAVISSSKIYNTIVDNGHNDPSCTIEFFHGYTYSAHPMAMAAGIATLEVYKDQKLFENAAAIAPHFEEAIHSLKGLPNVVDIRNIGLMGAVEMSAIPGYPTKRAMDVFDRMWKKGVVVRSAGPTIAFSPPLICEKSHIDEIFGKFADAIVESSNYF